MSNEICFFMCLVEQFSPNFLLNWSAISLPLEEFNPENLPTGSSKYCEGGKRHRGKLFDRHGVFF